MTQPGKPTKPSRRKPTVKSKQPEQNSLAAFFKSCRKSHASSNGGTKSAEKTGTIKSPSLPVFRQHHQDRKELCK